MITDAEGVFQPPKVAEYFQATVDGSGNLEKIFDIEKPCKET